MVTSSNFSHVARPPLFSPGPRTSFLTAVILTSTVSARILTLVDERYKEQVRRIIDPHQMVSTPAILNAPLYALAPALSGFLSLADAAILSGFSTIQRLAPEQLACPPLTLSADHSGDRPSNSGHIGSAPQFDLRLHLSDGNQRWSRRVLDPRPPGFESDQWVSKHGVGSECRILSTSNGTHRVLPRSG
jgi:hypothetical protein